MHIRLFSVPEVTLDEEALRVTRAARKTYATCMVVSAFAKIADVTNRSLAIVNAAKFMREDPGLSLDDLPKLVKDKIGGLV